MMPSNSHDPYAVTATAYDLFALSVHDDQVAALEALLPRVFPEAGPILDIGAGSGSNTAYLLEQLPEARILALEPSPSMRSLLLSKIATHPEWFPRVTVRPEDFFSATLPPRIAGAVLLGVFGHFDPGERAALLAELADRLPVGGGAVVDLQNPERPERIEPYEFTVAQVGELSYRGIAQAWPVDDEQMRWEMTYLTLEGERILIEDTATYTYRHPAPNAVRAEAAAVGLTLSRIGNSSYWLLTR
ncbi:MAG: class I SAM-dependent methyltransferase [Ancrocorticia sp.]